MAQSCVGGGTIAITQAPADVLSIALLRGRHAPANTYMMALYKDSATLGSSTTRYLTADETSGSGYTAGGQALQGYADAISSSTAYLDWSNISWPNSTMSAAGSIIYNSSLASNEALHVYTFSGTVEVSNGTFTVVMPPASATSAVLRVGAGT